MKEEANQFTFEPVTETDKISQLVSILQSYIIDNNLSPGTAIPPERELAEKLNVSRFSLREALRVAQAQGLVEINRGKRPRVAKPSSFAASKIMEITLRRSGHVLRDLVVARQGLETIIARLAAENATEEDIRALEKNINLMEENIDDADFYVQQDLEFHDLLLKLSDNVVFEIMMSSVGELLLKVREESLKKVKTKKAATGHKQILDAIKKHNPEEAAAAMHRHLEMAADEVAELEQNS
jgi:GntR family transcriptional repressor for pyruvate dehydrogenase complex